MHREDYHAHPANSHLTAHENGQGGEDLVPESWHKSVSDFSQSSKIPFVPLKGEQQSPPKATSLSRQNKQHGNSTPERHEEPAHQSKVENTTGLDSYTSSLRKIAAKFESLPKSKFGQGVTPVLEGLLAYCNDKAKEKSQEEMEEYMKLLISQHLPHFLQPEESPSGPSVDQMPALVQRAEDELDDEEEQAKNDSFLEKTDPQKLEAVKALRAHNERVKERAELREKQRANRAPGLLKNKQKLEEAEDEEKAKGWVAVLKAERLAFYPSDYPYLTGYRKSSNKKVPHDRRQHANPPAPDMVSASSVNGEQQRIQPHHQTLPSVENCPDDHSDWYDEEEETDSREHSMHQQASSHSYLALDQSDTQIQAWPQNFYLPDPEPKPPSSTQDEGLLPLAAPVSIQHKKHRNKKSPPGLLSPQQTWQYCAEANRA